MTLHEQDYLPDFVVGIDFGQTYTGVAWTNLVSANPTQSIQDWPGLPPDSIETKVPSKIAYPQDGTEAKWGFLCDADDDYEESEEVHQHFKIYLDQDSIDSARKRGVRNVPETVDVARQLITDYLRQIHQHIKFSLEATTGSWQDKRIEFVFSLPTTWRSLDTTNAFNDAIRAAGFTSGNPSKHIAKLELTEAEAAAVYIATNPQISLSKGDVILICDAGGGTTDLGLIEVNDPNPNMPSLKQVAAVKGVGIGSTMIDRAFELLVQRRLDAFPEAGLPEDLAYKLAKHPSFQSIKHKFGTRAGSQLTYKLRLDKLGLGISSDFTHSGLHIEGGVIQFSRGDIQGLFDMQVKGIVGQISKQLDWMQFNRSRDAVKYLVLSGGLGGSQYVKIKIEEYFEANPHLNAPGLITIKSQEPRLSVVKGLVMDRRQRLVSGSATLTTRIARASYGVLCRQPYDPDIHIGADVEIDRFNKKQKWATMQIDWIIRKGDTIDTDSAKERSFSRKIWPGDTNRRWNTNVVISHNERDDLPQNFKQPGVFKLCEIQSDLSEVEEQEFDVKNKHRWQGKRYYLATFVGKIIIAPADLKFELWFKNQRYNRNHDPITIEWDQAGTAVRPKSSDGTHQIHENDLWESYSPPFATSMLFR